MRRLSAIVLMAMLAALSISPLAQGQFVSGYDYDAKLVQESMPVGIEKTKIEVPDILLNTENPEVLGVQTTSCIINIKPGESKVEREARLAAEEAERQRLAAEAAAKAKARLTVLPYAGSSPAEASSDNWYRLRMCESGNTYSRNSGNGYYGAYQFNISTWRSYAPAGYKDVRPDLAPPAIQDQAALALYAKRGWQPWPACSRKLGLR